MEKGYERLSLVFIGAGNLATNLAKALYDKGFPIRQIYSRTEDSARVLSEKVSCGYTTDIKDVAKGADMYIVSVKDAALPGLLPELTKGKREALWVHTAGSLPAEIWNGYADRYGVLYPMQTFSKRRAVDFGKIPFFIEANSAEDNNVLEAVARMLSDRVYTITSEQRKCLHLAAVFACNFSNHMYSLIAELLERNNIPFDIMLPLIDETVSKIHEMSPHDAQTGPAVRYDENVMNMHLAMLEGNPEMQDIYKLISKSIHEHHQL